MAHLTDLFGQHFAPKLMLLHFAICKIADKSKVLGHALFDLRPHLPLQKPSPEKSCPLLLLSSPLRPQVPAPQLRSLCPNMLRVSLWYDAARDRVHARAEQAWVWYYVQDRIGRPSRGIGATNIELFLGKLWVFFLLLLLFLFLISTKPSCTTPWWRRTSASTPRGRGPSSGARGGGDD